MFKNNKIKSLLLIVLTISMLVSGCGANDKNESVAKVNGDNISLENYKQEYKIYRNLYESQLGEGVLDEDGPNGASIDEMLKEEIMDKLILEVLISQEAEANDVEVSDEEVEENLEDVIEYLGGKDQYSEFLIRSGFTNDYFKDNLKKEMIFAEYEKDYLEKLDLDEKDGKEYFEENKENLIITKASHILVEDEKTAKELLKKLDDGAKFEDLAREESIHEETKDQGGNLGYVSRGGVLASLPELEEAIFELKEGEISKVVQSEMGYHILKVEERKDSFKELKDETMDLLKQKNFQEHIEGLRDKAEIEIFQEKIDDIKVDKREDKKEDKKEDKQNEKESPEEDSKGK